MKRIITYVLILVFTLSILTSCGSKDNNTSMPATAMNDKASANPSPKEDDNTSGKVKEEIPGAELSTFMGSYMDTKSKLWDKMSKKFEEDQNVAFTMGSLAFVFADLTVVEIGLFDTLTTKEGDTFKGKMMLSGIEAWKKVKGDIIEFGYDFTNPEDKNQSKKGDREVASGKFDKKMGSLPMVTDCA